MIFEAPRMRRKVERLSSTNRTEITDEFLRSLPENTKLYQAYSIGMGEQISKENITVNLLEVFANLTDIERTRLMEISHTMVVKSNA